MDIVSLLITVLILAIVIGLLLYLVDSAPFVPAPIKPILHWIVVAVAVIWCIALLLSFVGMGAGSPPLFHWHR